MRRSVAGVPLPARRCRHGRGPSPLQGFIAAKPGVLERHRVGTRRLALRHHPRQATAADGQPGGECGPHRARREPSRACGATYRDGGWRAPPADGRRPASRAAVHDRRDRPGGRPLRGAADEDHAPARPASEITLGGVVRAIEPDFATVECFPGGKVCSLTGSCRLTGVLHGSLMTFRSRRDRCRLADILEPTPPAPRTVAFEPSAKTAAR